MMVVGWRFQLQGQVSIAVWLIQEYPVHDDSTLQKKNNTKNTRFRAPRCDGSQHQTPSIALGWDDDDDGPGNPQHSSCRRIKRGSRFHGEYNVHQQPAQVRKKIKNRNLLSSVVDLTSMQGGMGSPQRTITHPDNCQTFLRCNPPRPTMRTTHRTASPFVRHKRRR